MASHIVGFLGLAPNRGLKFSLDSFLSGKSSAEELQKAAADLKTATWMRMADAGIKFIPSNTFSYYDPVLDTTAMLGAVPPRYNWNGGEIGFDVCFSMARGNAVEPPLESTKWFDTDHHYFVPELGPDVRFSYASHKAVEEYKEAKALGVNTMPVLLGPVSYLLLSKPAEGVEESFSPLSLVDMILPVYKEVVADLKAAGATWIQFDEPTLVRDLNAHQLQALTHAYAELESSLSGLNVLIQTYSADVTAEAYETLISLKAVTAYGFDFVHGTKTHDLIMGRFPSGKFLFAGVVNGGDQWADNLGASLSTLLLLESIVGKDKVVVSTPVYLLPAAVYLAKSLSVRKEELSAGKQSRSALLSISATLEKSDEVFLKKEEMEEILKSLESMKNEWLKAKRDIVCKEIQDLEEEIAGVKKLIKELKKAHERLVLLTIEQIEQVRDCETIVIASEYEFHLLKDYCIGAVPNKMVIIDADLKGEELKHVIDQVQMRGWLWRSM